SILIAEPTYGMYAVCADVNAVNIQKVPLTTDFDLDVHSVMRACTPSTKLIFLCSPNNPTGNILDREKVMTLLETFRGVVVVDEAYIDFANTRSFVEELEHFPNLVVMQTFSKAWGLAGLRLGICYASEYIISLLNKIKYPYNVNIVTQQIASEALEAYARKDQWVESILKERAQLKNALAALSFVQVVYRSDANFVLVKMNNARAVYHYLMEKGIIVRDRSRVSLCDNCLRITVGTSSENQQLIQALKTYEKSPLY
ncbi:MAG TPA: histidinol-phosphate transaminase, partial [Chryseosolibacter sp.]|nr:histidinol-phosphate transaminase [Chryseosolibacter sp.]